MESMDNIKEASEATVEFESALRSLVLDAFARGAAVEGTWEIDLPPELVPNWTVEVRKLSAEEDEDDE